MPEPNLFRLVLTLLAEKNYAEIERIIAHALTRGEDPVALMFLAHVRRMQGRFDDAEAAARRALAAAPDYPEALNELGLTLQATNRHAEARDVFEVAIRIRPGFVAAHLNLGNAHDALGDLDAAVVHTRKAASLDPSQAGAHDNLAHLLYRQGKLDEAEEACRAAIGAAPHWAQPHYHLGVVHAKRDEWDEAEDAMRAAVRLEPHNREFRTGLRTLMQRADYGEMQISQYQRQTLRLPGADHLPAVRYNGAAVPVIRVRDSLQYEQLTTALRTLATRQRPVCFRGQTRDWFEGGRDLDIRPARFRKALSGDDAARGIEAWRAALRPFLGDLADGDRAAMALEHVSIHPPPVAASGHMADLMFQPELAGTMQHYGFPTDFLDVTSDPSVALWFALHRCEGRPLHYVPVSPAASDSVDLWPSVYVFHPLRTYVVDLTDGCLTETVSPRAFHQRASLISLFFYNVSLLSAFRPSRPRGYTANIQSADPSLVLTLKLEPNDAWSAYAAAPQDELFPADDAIYRALDAADVAHLARYA